MQGESLSSLNTVEVLLLMYFFSTYSHTKVYTLYKLETEICLPSTKVNTYKTLHLITLSSLIISLQIKYQMKPN